MLGNKTQTKKQTFTSSWIKKTSDTYPKSKSSVLSRAHTHTHTWEILTPYKLLMLCHAYQDRGRGQRMCAIVLSSSFFSSRPHVPSTSSACGHRAVPASPGERRRWAGHCRGPCTRPCSRNRPRNHRTNPAGDLLCVWRVVCFVFVCWTSVSFLCVLSVCFFKNNYFHMQF